MVSITDNHIEDNENKFCSLWTTFQRIDDCANLFLNNKLRGDYFFNRLNNLQFCGKIEDTLDKASEICSKNKHDLYVHIPYTSNNSPLIALLLERGFRLVDRMYVLKIANHLHVTGERSKPGLHINIEVQKESELWVRVFCDSFSVRTWKHEVSKIINRNKNNLALIIANIAEKPNNPVGCMLLYKFHNITGLYCLGTLKSFRRKGIASKMVEFAASYERQMNSEFLIVHSLANENTINIYRNLGFEKVEVKAILASRFLRC